MTTHSPAVGGTSRSEEPVAAPEPGTGYGAFAAGAFARKSLPRRVFGTRRGLRMALGLALAVIAGAGVLFVTSQSEPTVAALQLVRPMAANTQVTADDVAPFTAPLSAWPDPSQLITDAQIASGRAYTYVAMQQGAVLTLGAVGPYVRTLDQVPEGMKLASITAPAKMAAGGTIRAGDVVDIYVVSRDDIPADMTAGIAEPSPTPLPSSSGSSEPLPSSSAAPAPSSSSAPLASPAPRATVAVPSAGALPDALATSTGRVRALVGVRILDVQVDLDPIANANASVPVDEAPGPDAPALKGGVPSTYQVAVTPEDARLLAYIAAGGGSLYLTVAPQLAASASPSPSPVPVA